MSRENTYSEEAVEDDDEDDETDQSHQAELETGDEESLVPGLSTELPDFVGFNGRCNKRVDTCYAFWVSASLDVCALSHFPYLTN